MLYSAVIHPCRSLLKRERFLQGSGADHFGVATSISAELPRWEMNPGTMFTDAFAPGTVVRTKECVFDRAIFQCHHSISSMAAQELAAQPAKFFH